MGGMLDSQTEDQLDVRMPSMASELAVGELDLLHPREEPISCEPLPGLSLVPRSFASYRHGEWDGVAVAADASFLGSWKVIKAGRILGKTRLFDFLLNNGPEAPEKIGQCAVRVGRNQVKFLDRIQLSPRYAHLWNQCFWLVVGHLGESTYHYGSHWNDEDRSSPTATPSPEGALERNFHIDVIDLRAGETFAAYRRRISENIRRDYRKAHDAAATFTTRSGLGTLRDIVGLVTLRGHMMRRNNIRFSPLADLFLHTAKVIVLGSNAIITTVRVDGKCYAAFFGAQFGRNLYYISGGTRKNRLGAGSYLFMNLFEAWFSKHRNGRVLMGDCPGEEVTHDSGALLYRRKLRFRPVRGAEFELKV